MTAYSWGKKGLLGSTLQLQTQNYAIQRNGEGANETRLSKASHSFEKSNMEKKLMNTLV
jgi:hypothetical protein